MMLYEVTFDDGMFGRDATSILATLGHAEDAGWWRDARLKERPKWTRYSGRYAIRPRATGHEETTRMMRDAIEPLDDDRCRDLLSLACEFEVGPLLPDAPDGWTWGGLGHREATSHLARIQRRFQPGRIVWTISTPCHSRNGRWYLRNDGAPGPAPEVITEALFPSAVAAWEALERWRAARRAEFDEATITETVIRRSGSL